MDRIRSVMKYSKFEGSNTETTSVLHQRPRLQLFAECTAAAVLSLLEVVPLRLHL